MGCIHTKKTTGVLDYSDDWSAWLVADTISTSSWVVTGGLVVDSDSIGSPATSTSVWISGGTFGATGEATNTIVTAAGRTVSRTIVVRII